MKTFFDFKRFSNLVRLFFVEQAKVLGLYFLLTFVVLVLVLNLVYSGSTAYRDLRYVFLLLYLIVNMSIVTGVSVQDFKKKSTLSFYLSIPNSALEKTLMYVLVYGAFFMGITTLLFVLGDYTTVKEIIPPILSLNQSQGTSVVRPTLEFMSFNKEFYEVMSFVMFFYYFGSFTFFIINKKIKALVSLFFIGILIGSSAFLNYVFFRNIPVKNYLIGPFNRVSIKNNYMNWKENYYVVGGELSDNFIYLYVWLPLCLFGVAIYYFKLKEQEI